MSARRLFLISYHFPPSEEAGALRWQRLAPIAVERGWSVEAFTLAPGVPRRIDWERVNELPPTVRIHGVVEPVPYLARAERGLYQAWRVLRRRIRQNGGPASAGRPASVRQEEIRWFTGGVRSLVRASNVLVSHEREMAWAREAVVAGRRAGAVHPPALIVSCGPPHQVHEAGRRLARHFRVPFVMDMRDPWSLQFRLQEDHASPLWFRLAHRAEARCVAEADLIVMNTPIAAEAMRAKWPSARVMSVYNGWDAEPLVSLHWPHQFRIVYAGSIYIDRSPGPLFQAVSRVVQRLKLSPADFQVRFIGEVPEDLMDTLARDANIPGYVQVIPPIPRKQVLREYAEAAVLLSLPQDSYFAIPSKVFEYMRQPCWIVAQTEGRSATGDVLAGSAAFVAAPEEIGRLAGFLQRCYREFRSGNRPAPIAQDGRFSRRVEGERFMGALEELVSGGSVAQQTQGRL